MDRLRFTAWVKDRYDDIQNSPPLTISVVFFIIYALEKIWSGTAYAIASASIGAGVLYIFQMREELWPAPLQRLFGIEVSPDSELASDELDEDDDQRDDDDSLFAREAGEDGEDECFRGDEDWLSRGRDSHRAVGHGAEEDGHILSHLTCQDGSNANETEGISRDWLEMLNQELVASGAQIERPRGSGPEVAAAEEEPPDPVNKARLDLLFRYLASMDARNGEQGATPQRQKLQRKLLQRTAAGEHLGAAKAGKKAPAVNGVAVAADVADAPHNEENLLEDSSKIEALLRELGEPNGASHPKAQGPSKRARRKGTTSSPTKTAPAPVIKIAEPEAQETKAPTVKKSAPAEEAPPSHAINGKTVPVKPTPSRSSEKRRNYDSDSDPNREDLSLVETAEEAIEVDDSEPIGFQVVENKKARKKLQKEDRLKADAEAKAEAMVKMAEAKAKADAIKAEAAVKKAVAETEATSERSKSTSRSNERAEEAKAKEHEEFTTKKTTAKESRGKAEDTTDGTMHAEAAATNEGQEETTPPPMPSDVQCEGREREHEDAADGEEECDEDDEAWEWQCPDGFLLQPYTCPRPVACCSCGKMQPENASVLRAEETGWLACQDCIQIAWEQPVEPLDWNKDRQVEVADPSKMSALEIATWFKERGAESELRRCMTEVMEARSAFTEAQQQDGLLQQSEESMPAQS